MLFLGFYINENFDQTNLSSITSRDIFRAAMVITSIILIQAVLGFISSYSVSVGASAMIRDLRNAIFKKLLTLGHTYVDKESSGALQNRIISDTAQVGFSVAALAPEIVTSVIGIVGSIVGIFYTNPSLSGLVTISVLLFAVPVFFFNNMFRNKGNLTQTAEASSGQFVGEILRNLLVVIAFNQQNREIERFSERTDEVRERFLSEDRTQSVVMYLFQALLFVFLVFIVIFAINQVREDQIQMGSVVAFVYFAIFFTTRAIGIVGIVSRLGVLQGKATKVLEVLAEPPTINQGQLEPPRDFEIGFEDVTYVYPERDSHALRDCNITFRARQTTALVGISGSGKSTIFKLLLRSIDPSSGKILVSGQYDLDSIGLEQWRSKLAYVPQSEGLMSGTISENISYGRPKASRSEIILAAEKAFAHEFISKLPLGYETVLGEAGSRLSVGQQQRIAIARAILTDASCYLFDEITSALDHESELSVTKALVNLSESSLVIVIAHRLDTIKNADSVVLLDEGEVLAQGTFEAVRDLPEFRRVIES